MVMVGKEEELLKDRLRMPLRSEVGGCFPGQHDHRPPIPPGICPSLNEPRLALEIPRTCQHDHWDVINLGLEPNRKG